MEAAMKLEQNQNVANKQMKVTIIVLNATSPRLLYYM